MRSLFLAMAILCAAVQRPTVADDLIEVDLAEVLRLGDLVQRLGSRIGAPAGDDAYVEAMGPPASDADKWFITVITKRGCGGCERLKRDFASDPWLLALANPSDPEKSWSHYNVYSIDDRSQSWRFRNIRITAYPTVLVQPPRSRKYGESSTVVYQGVYDGDPRHLATEITSAVRRYVAKFQAPRQSSDEPGSGATGRVVGVDPPWQPAPLDDPFAPNVNPILPPVNVPVQIPPAPQTEPKPEPKPDSEFPWTALLSLVTAGFSLPAAAAIVVWLLY